MAQNLADGQLAASTSTLLGAAPPAARRRAVDVKLYNTSSSSTETVTMTVSVNGGTARTLLRIDLAPYETLQVDNLALDDADVLAGYTDTASTVNYVVSHGSGGPYDVRVLDANGAFKQVASALSRSSLALEGAAAHAVPLVGPLRVWDAVATVLPATAANDDLGLITNTWGTSAPTVEGGDSKAATTTRYARFQFAVPVEYAAGEAITLRVNAGMKTTVSDTTATLDAEVYRAAAPGTDVCATAAQSINSLTAADKDFTVTPTDVVPGDVLDVRLAVAVVDGATATAVIGQINRITFLMGTRG